MLDTVFSTPFSRNYRMITSVLQNIKFSNLIKFKHVGGMTISVVKPLYTKQKLFIVQSWPHVATLDNLQLN